MAYTRIVTTSNNSQKAEYLRGTTQAVGSPYGGVCRTMVLTWIRESQLGVSMRAMGDVLTGGGFAQIEFRHRSWKMRMGYAQEDERAQDAVRMDVLHSFSLQRVGEPMGIQTNLIGFSLDPKALEDSKETAYTMLTLSGEFGHALGLAFYVAGLHYFLDPNSGLYECDSLAEMLGPTGHVTNHILTNYCRQYPSAMLEQYKSF